MLIGLGYLVDIDYKLERIGSWIDLLRKFMIHTEYRFWTLKFKSHILGLLLVFVFWSCMIQSWVEYYRLCYEFANTLRREPKNIELFFNISL